MGMRLDGVPLKPTRWSHSISPPTSWPDEASFIDWWRIVGGKMKLRR